MGNSCSQQNPSMPTRSTSRARIPSVLLEHLDSNGIDIAVLVPFTRGLNANCNHATAICSATNRWLIETWLTEWNQHRRFYGSICVNPRDPDAAVAEIRRWKDHPAVAQVVVPSLVHAPYGQRAYHPIWAEAAEHALPVAVRADGASGLEFPPTPVGYPRFFVEYWCQASGSFAPHLASLIAEGVFDRYPGLKFVFADGGHDLSTQLIWRLDTTFPACRGETPWVKRMPSGYMSDHVRFVSAKHEHQELSPAELADWVRFSRADELLMFASHFPHWTTMTPKELLNPLPVESRQAMLSTNAAGFYGDRLSIQANAPAVSS